VKGRRRITDILPSDMHPRMFYTYYREVYTPLAHPIPHDSLG